MDRLMGLIETQAEMEDDLRGGYLDVSQVFRALVVDDEDDIWIYAMVEKGTRG
jgi:hypothetical protein